MLSAVSGRFNERRHTYVSLECSEMNVPVLVAHRGYARRYPENTLESLSAALAAGACYIEFDVQLTADLVAVLMHDPDLERTAGRPDRVGELTWRELSMIAVGQRDVFGRQFDQVRIPTLASAIELLSRWPRAEAFVEIKPESIDRCGVEPVLARIVDDIAVARSHCIVVSATDRFLRRARTDAGMRIGLVLRQWSAAARQMLSDLEPEFVFCNVERLPPAADLWRGPWRWVVYEIVEPTVALALAARGVELVETMAIGEMLADPLLERRGCGG
jgi:glycerophosphoryl diester phosphodiesterase